MIKHSHSQLDSPDCCRFRSLYFQIIRLLLHLKFSENQGDGVPRICQDGPLTLPTAAQASSTSTSASARRLTAGEIEAGDEPAGAPQGATARVLRCQSPERKAGWGGWGKNRHVVSGLFQSYYSKLNMGHEKSGLRHKTSVPVLSDKCKPEQDQCGSWCQSSTGHLSTILFFTHPQVVESKANSSTIMGFLTIWNIRLKDGLFSSYWQESWSIQTWDNGQNYLPIIVC